MAVLLVIGLSVDELFITDDERVSRFVVAVTFLIGIVMVLGPLWTLAYVEKPVHKLVVIRYPSQYPCASFNSEQLHDPPRLGLLQSCEYSKKNIHCPAS
jgi:hypothetical protein